MANASALDRQIWAEFQSNPDAIIHAFQMQTGRIEPPENLLPQTQGMAEEPAEFVFHKSGERRIEINQRIGQNFFRSIILTAYRERCALTGIEDKKLLNASHIVAWKDDPINRVNPSNGICLNALHDRAFDRHLITFDDDYRLQISPNVPSIARRELQRVESQTLALPERFLPDQIFLEKHRRKFFEVSRATN